jgi:glycosyltransferase involved in cell wall biosynthesis
VGRRDEGSATPLSIAVIVCAHDEAGFVGPCLHSLQAQTRVPDAVVLVDNDSHDRTAEVAAAIPGVRVVAEPRRGLVRARERGRQATDADLLLFIDADCRAPLHWVERVERRFVRRPDLVALSARTGSTTGTPPGGRSSALTISPSRRRRTCW